MHWRLDYEWAFLYVLVAAFAFEANNFAASLYFAPFLCIALGVLFMNFP